MDRLAKRATAIAGAIEELPPAIKVGDFIKIFLRCNSLEATCVCESPWAECVAVYADGTWHGRIDNHLVATE